MNKIQKATLGFTVITVSIIFGLSTFIKPSSNEFRKSGFEILYHKEPFTGVIYDMYRKKKLRHLTFVWRGKKVGKEYFWHKNGRISSIYEYKDGSHNGKWRQWYEDGSVRSLRQFVDGKAHGEYWTWHPNGVVSNYRVYEHGSEKVFKSFISDGKPFYNYTFQDGKRIGVKGGSFCKTRTKSL